jgi:chromate transporter
MVEASLKGEGGVLWVLAIYFVVLSFFAVGGVNTLLPDMHHQAVEAQGWMSSQRFTDLFAIAQAAPGPNLTVVTLIGWQAAGIPGALVTTIAVVGPTSVLTYFVAGIWERFRRARWRIATQAGLVPITVGLVAATAYVLAGAADKTPVAVIVTFGTAVAVYFTRVHPLIFLAAGAVLGVAGLI